MPSVDNDDWSDSDDEVLSEVETSTLLGVPDGPLDDSVSSELLDAAVSRIGGKPAFLSPDIPFSSSSCKNCNQPMELLVQMWCPFEDSAYDRALYVWACAKGACQRREGALRAWRGLRLNEEYAAKLAKKKRARTPAPAPPSEMKSKINPFAIGAAAAATGPFGGGLGAQLFGGAPEEPATAPATEEPTAEEPTAPETEDDDGAASDAESSSSASSLVVALASTTLEDSPWAEAPSYAPQYLSTVSEYIVPPKEKKAVKATEDALADEQDAKGTWTAEKYENSLDTDRVFDRFNERVAAEAEQCVRYELGGTPLPFATDDVFKRLFPALGQKAGATIVTGAVFAAGVDESRRSYDPTSIPTCPLCGERRVFECQLMPNLINVVRDKTAGGEQEKGVTEEERRRTVEKLIKGGAEDVRGMEWGTAMVFSCENDCCKEKNGWTEEVVLVQWDN
ncbi:hypothetical protein PENSPDRAFT_659653 [Peniophora sp. CONT]|nr:hypothetical protein PENSPDRAFT_659653 [Peniophora sp. CONT]